LRPLALSLIAVSAAIILMLGLIHLFFTFQGHRLHPRDRDLRARLDEVCPVLTSETTMWKAWIGFNASHSFGAMLFGTMYAYLAVVHGRFLLQSWFLLGLGLLFLAGYVFLSKRYWFSVPYRGILLATTLYVLALVAAAA
jgi:hypothetical protein